MFERYIRVLGNGNNFQFSREFLKKVSNKKILHKERSNIYTNITINLQNILDVAR